MMLSQDKVLTIRSCLFCFKFHASFINLDGVVIVDGFKVVFLVVKLENDFLSFGNCPSNIHIWQHHGTLV